MFELSGFSVAFIGFWIIASGIVGIGAHTRGRSGFGYLALSFLISPLLTFMLLVLMPVQERTAAQQDDQDVEFVENKPATMVFAACCVAVVVALVYLKSGGML
jgi:hypothetical protein